MFKSIMILCGLMTTSVHASELNSGDTAWILTSTALVLFMTLPGLALFYGGLVRSKNVLSVLMQCFAIACLISVCWVVYGYSLAFKGDGLFIGDLSAVFLNGVGERFFIRHFTRICFHNFSNDFCNNNPCSCCRCFC